MGIEDQVRWAVEFSKLDLNQVDIKKLREELFDWFTGLRTQVAARQMILPSPYPTAKTDYFQDLQDEVRVILADQIVRLNKDADDPMMHLIPIRSKWALFTTPNGNVLQVSGPPRDVFLLTLFLLLRDLRGNWILKCEECGTIYFRAGRRQTFCSPTCKNRVMQRRWRERNKQKESERQRKKYERKIKKQIGPNVAVKKRRK